MPVCTYHEHIKTQGECDVLDITPIVESALSKSRLGEGVVNVFVPGATAAVTTIEYEPGAVHDLRDAIERIVPRTARYQHDARWGDGNGYSHVRAALLKAGLSIPFQRGSMLLGTWQQIILIDFDNRPRNREVVIQIFGE
jgi:secondary thiamine-phosphate synthase enzyme